MIDSFCLAMFGAGLILVGIECVALALDEIRKDKSMTQKEFADMCRRRSQENSKDE